jgi:UDPglucose 6-dehydrogenase
VCVPTPSSLTTGEIDDAILSNVIDSLSNVSGIVIVKSTITPDKLNGYLAKYPTLKLVDCPEFLTERNYANDAIYPRMILVGGETSIASKVKSLYENYSRCQTNDYIVTDIVTSALVKYAINTFLATKVAFMNQLYDVFMQSGSKADWSQFTKIMNVDNRIGGSHMMVPGIDKMRGFGGRCFPKDITAFVKYGESLGADMSLLKVAWDYNKKIREDQDWINIDGAMSK